MNFSVFLAGMSTLLSLIVAIGAQNAFVLRQGLRNEHVLAVVTICALSDAILITLGVTSFGKIALRAPWLDPAMRYGGACFLAWYGVKRLNSALRSTMALSPEGSTERANLMPVMLACLALTWLNPHVYLDTVVLLGAISTQFPGAEASFAAGAISGSFLFFVSLGYGATRLRPLFARPSAWRTFEATIALVMWSISFRLIASV
jgi:L-lysine exporter family protein LysE/ArgO